MIGEAMRQHDDAMEPALRIPVPVQKALAVYFDVILKCRFSLNGEAIGSNEVFHEAAFLPVVADTADQFNRTLFGGPLSIEIHEDETALVGRRVVLPDTIDQGLLLKMLRGAEIVFGSEADRDIDLMTLYESCWTRDEPSQSATESNTQQRP